MESFDTALEVGRYVARVLEEAKRLIVAQPGVTILGKGTGYGPGLDLAGWGRSGRGTRLVPGVGRGRAGWVERINVVKKGPVGGDE